MPEEALQPVSNVHWNKDTPEGLGPVEEFMVGVGQP